MTKKPPQDAGTRGQKRFGLRGDAFAYRLKETSPATGETPDPDALNDDLALFRTEAGCIFAVLMRSDGKASVERIDRAELVDFLSSHGKFEKNLDDFTIYRSITVIPDRFSEFLYLLIARSADLYPLQDMSRAIDVFKLALNRLEQEIKAAKDGRELQDEADKLWQEFGRSALGRSAERGADAVAAEIAAEVRIRWADRKSPENKGQPWTKGPIPFIKHWYAKWLDAGTIKRAHLRHDGQLYNAYVAYLRRCQAIGETPELLLRAESKEGYVRGQALEEGDAPPRAARWIPKADLTPEEREKRRAYEAQRKRRQRKVPAGH